MKTTYKDLKKSALFKKTALSIAVALIAVGGHVPNANAELTLDHNNVLYYYGGSTPLGDYDLINVTTTGTGATSPLGGFGVYLQTNGMNAPNLKDITIKTSGSAADGVRGNSEAVFFKARNLTIETTGSSADGINAASDFNNDYDSLVYVTESTNISVKDGVAVRANNFQNAGANSIIILAGKNVLKVVGTGTAANAADSKGYAVYAGNRDRDTNGMGIMDILQGKNHNTKGNAYVFIGDDSEISTTTKGGHAVYANKGGLIQLGDGVDIATTGENAFAIYASTEQQGTYTDNVRPGTVYLAGGAKLRTAASADVIQANGVDSVISSQAIVMPVVADTHLRTDSLNPDRTVLTDSEGVFDIEGNINAINGGTVALNMADTSLFVGSTSVDATSKVNLNVKGSGSLWTMTKDSTLTDLTLNGATVAWQSPGADETFVPKTLTVEGNYVGNGGTIVLNTVLGGDDSLTDKLIVKGDTSGNTSVGINNIGGAGELTVEGIKIVEVAGNSDGTFAKAGRIVAGAYDYDVVKKASDWYLTSELTPVDPPEEPDPEPVDPPEPPPPPDPVDPVDPPEPPEPPAPPTPASPPKPEGPPAPPTPVEHQYRPEFGSYLANNYAANTMFITRLHDRLGETQYTDVLTGEEKVTSMWIRNEGGRTRFDDASGQLRTTANRYVLQIGGDLAQWSSDSLDRWHLGAMAGYANQKSKTRNDHTGYASRGSVDGYSVGLYATWYANEADKTGTYLDSWVLYNWFDNTVRGDHLASESYKSDGITASVEGGYSFLMGESEKASYWIQPKAQVIWMDVQADAHRERNGTLVKDKTDGNLMTRLGVRAYLKGHAEKDAGKGRDFQPFVEANWIHNTSNQAVQMGSITDEISGTRNIGELKVGVEGQVTPRLQVWGNVAQQVGDNSYSDTSAMLGVKYTF
ncbi:autotransporter outer membrane beta-barrel domain-containing protein [Citrobacter rodentium]|uniref:Adhesin autotransporter n=2 Tax=Citrobacter rodentium TaxID=67825 RepID=D2TUB4_CITRI|nr:autotransporter outer membrane beta-barrel domain-containing protein [Citrobacter rodentium]KIQ52960.1 autotransporter [Citrobacter rodentium]QBY30209.1 autotransporter outer membrane beta-barrel domain-containing protein [Citrobacter rodentium]UHO32416.1 autotransporter outer membrane beta-barrel domain-containing protein [Citrobacter rodentium NBRC 105723 = DSM 16636]CBG90580.1 putative adhesin autotransporter [Citrobacter rodentium ICC168]